MSQEAKSNGKRRSIHDLLEEARRGLRRLTAEEAARAQGEGAILVDTRSADQRAAQGVVRGARLYPLSELEWWLDPESGHADPAAKVTDWIVLLCAEGYSSSLAAARLQALGFARATDVVDGVEGWKAAGLPIEAARSGGLSAQ
jgi:rhodanese-related sulfurtransferase